MGEGIPPEAMIKIRASRWWGNGASSVGINPTSLSSCPHIKEPHVVQSVEVNLGAQSRARRMEMRPGNRMACHVTVGRVSSIGTAVG